MKVLKQDILTVSSGVIVHPVSNTGGFEKGLSQAIARVFPKIIDPYELCCRSAKSPLDLLGRVLVVKVSDTLQVANLFCIHDSKSKKHFEYMAFLSCLDKLKDIGEKTGGIHGPLLFPYKMGTGLLGGDWKEVERLIQSTLGDAAAAVCILETKK